MIKIEDVTDKHLVDHYLALEESCPMCQTSLKNLPSNEVAAQQLVIFLAIADRIRDSIKLGPMETAGWCRSLIHIGIQMGINMANEKELEDLYSKEAK